jgi:hypothetical protein
VNKVLIIFECDAQRSYSSYVIKYLTTNKTYANKMFVKLKREWDASEDNYTLNLGEYDPNPNASCGSNIFNEITLLKTTEKNENNSNK